MTPRKKPTENVLIVEDDAETAESLAEVLNLMGYHSDVAENGQIALGILRGAPQKYCLVLLDIMMPVMDGWGFLVEQASDKAIADIPVVIVTAVLNARTKAGTTGAVALLPKPVDPMKLEATLQQYC
jgi:CheY-like chemotaxis protein